MSFQQTGLADAKHPLAPFFAELGEILDITPLAEGVWYVAAAANGTTFAQEYYAVLQETPVISLQAKKYGKAFQGGYFYTMCEDAGGWRIVQYELHRYLVAQGIPLPEGHILEDTALFAAEFHPEYFGEYPVPFETPWGITLRHRRVDNGVYWLETAQCQEALAVCCPYWRVEFSETAKRLGKFLDFGSMKFGYLFFDTETSCIPVYELLCSRPEWEGRRVHKAALLRAVWNFDSRYASSINLLGETGFCDERKPTKNAAKQTGKIVDFCRDFDKGYWIW